MEPMVVNPGIIYAFLAFAAWGLLPLFWKTLVTVPAFEILCHRMLWSAMTIALILIVGRRMKATIAAVRSPRTIGLFLVTGLLVGANWFTYIWAVNNNYVLESSLGYFMNPLINVLLGRLFLKEQLRPVQKIAVGFALVGVLYLAVVYGQFPWIALTLAFTFAFYGLLRKVAAAGSLEGLFVETALLIVPALYFLVASESSTSPGFFELSTQTQILLIVAGPLTALPLYWYTKGARLITLSTLGIMQYIAPSIQFLLAVLVFNEPFSFEQLTAFLFIWTGLVLFSSEGYLMHRRSLAIRGESA